MLVDYGKKYVQPSKYDCQLCMVTYGAFGMKSDWKKYIKSLNYDVEFLHKDEISTKYPGLKVALPAVIAVDDGSFKVILSAKDFIKIDSLGSLIKTLDVKLG